MAVSDCVLAHVINPAHSHTTEGAILCQWGERITSKGEELNSPHPTYQLDFGTNAPPLDLSLGIQRKEK